MVRGVERGSEIRSNARSYAALDYAFPNFSRLFQQKDLRPHIRFSRGVCAPYSLWDGGCSTYIAVVVPISATHRSSSQVNVGSHTVVSANTRQGCARWYICSPASRRETLPANKPPNKGRSCNGIYQLFRRCPRKRQGMPQVQVRFPFCRRLGQHR